MLSQKDQLTELVRELESRKHIFATDPLLITEKMQNEKAATSPESGLQKLRRRAQLIDSNGKIAKTLAKIDTRIKAIILIMSVVWCASGFTGLFALLQANVVNFFYVLVCLLGFHTLMLVGWILMTLISKDDKPTIFASFVSPSHLIRGKDDITTSAVNIYEKQLHHAGMRWYLGKISHQLWLATLAGMLIALIVLLMVRDYNFSWESTLLSGQTIATLVSWMAWLPNLVGFATPSPEQVLASQQFANQMGEASGSVMSGVSSYEWAMLLIGSLLMYGIIPRAILWIFCALMFNRKKMALDIKLPYYQKILDFWSRTVTDEDDFVEESTLSVAPKATINNGNKLVALLEHPQPNPNWFSKALTDNATNIYNFGILDSRDDMDRLVDYLNKNEVQVLLGIDEDALPDRGTMRKLKKIAAIASEGLVVQLLEDNKHPNDAQRLQQWQKALAEQQIGLFS